MKYYIIFNRINKGKTMRVNVLKNSGFCGGVIRALHILDKTIKENENKTIYLLGEIVHNSLVKEK